MHRLAAPLVFLISAASILPLYLLSGDDNHLPVSIQGMDLPIVIATLAKEKRTTTEKLVLATAPGALHRRPVESVALKWTDKTPIIPIVIMVFKRVDYLRQLIDSLMGSDFDPRRVPLIISQDGHVPNMTLYLDEMVQSKKFSMVHRMVHPYSCFDHPRGFPNVLEGDESLNTTATRRHVCAKHHFSWMIQAVFTKFTDRYTHFLFLEEDYILAPNFYETIVQGLRIFNVYNGTVSLSTPTLRTPQALFGISLDPTDGNQRPIISSSRRTAAHQPGFFFKTFQTNPIVLGRDMLERLLLSRLSGSKTAVNAASIFCEFDDYNWDWSIVHLQQQTQSLLPSLVMVPTLPMAKHIGLAQGMHGGGGVNKYQMQRVLLAPREYHVGTTVFLDRVLLLDFRNKPGFGGWSDPADHNHCKQVLRVHNATT